MDKRQFFVFTAIFIASVTVTVLAGPIWDCGDPTDSGGTPDTATRVSGSGPLAAITCSLTGQTFNLNGDDAGDSEDMFLILIDDPINFEALTVMPQSGNFFNTQIFLFDEDGRGILANTTGPGNDQFSFLGPQANDGSGSMLVKPGLYHIAISGGEKGTRGRHPVDAGGNPIFNFDPAQPELIYGPATSNPVTGWKGEGELGDYEIQFLGVSFAPPLAAIPTVSEWGLIVFGLLLLCAGTIVIRRQQYHQRNAQIAPA